MGIVLYILGLFFSFLVGYLFLKLFLKSENKNFFYIEYLIYSFFSGIVIQMFYLFLVGWIGFSLNLLNILILNLILTLVLGILNKFYKTNIIFIKFNLIFKEFINLTKFYKILFFITIIWIGIKLSLGLISIINVPTYQDDTFGNWNFRAKVFYERESLVLDKNDIDFLGNGYKQYPLTPSLYKTYLSKFYGSWNEGLVNLPSFIYYILGIILMFFVLFKETNNIKLSLLGIYILSAIPLYYIHGTNPYMDVMQGIYLFLAFYGLYIWYKSDEFIFLNFGLIFIALNGFVKSEGLSIYLPILIFTVFIIFILKNKYNKFKSILNLIKNIKYSLFLFFIPLIFIFFKFIYGLGFGNGNSNVSNFGISFSYDAFNSILNNTLMGGGGFGLFFVFFFITLLLVIKEIFKKDNKIIIFSLFFTILLFLIMIGLLVFINNLHNEAISQIGSNRIIIQLIFLFVFIEILLINIKDKKGI